MLRLKLSNTYRKGGGTRRVNVTMVDGTLQEPLFHTAAGNDISVGDRILLTRDGGGYPSFSEARAVTGVDTDIEGNTVFSLGVFPDYELRPSRVSYAKIPKNFDECSGGTDFVVMEFTDGNAHMLADDRHGLNVHENVTGCYENGVLGIRRCEGDFFTYETKFLYRSGKIRDNGLYGGNMTNENTSSGTFVYYDENKFLDVIVPLDGYHRDDVHLLYCRPRILSCAEFVTLYPSVTLMATDQRFVRKSDDGGLSLWDGVKVTLDKDYIPVKMGLSSSIGIDLHRDDNLSRYSEMVKERSIEPIVDYEKVQFVPYYKEVGENGGYHPMRGIDIIPHFRTRVAGEDGSLNVVADGLWQNYEPSEKWKYATLKKGMLDTDADLVGGMGYTDSDVSTEAKCLSKSFLRLMFYDTPNRATQSLLYYSTVFVDSNRLHGRYIKAVSERERHGDEYAYVKDEHLSNRDLRLDMLFGLRDKYMAEGSSEGFYCYFFPGIVNGTAERTLYMRITYNNAKNGETVPFVMPVRIKDGISQAVFPEDREFPFNYARMSGATIYVDMERYSADTYIEVGVRYDSNLRQYIWYPKNPLRADDGIVKMILFEPRLNPGNEGIQTDSYREAAPEPPETIVYDNDGSKVMVRYDVRTEGAYNLCNPAFYRAVDKMTITTKSQNNVAMAETVAADDEPYGYRRQLYQGITTVVYRLKDGETDVPDDSFRGIEAMDGGIFRYMVTDALFNDGIENIGGGCLMDTMVSNVSFGSGMRTIGPSAFVNSKITVIDLSGCRNLEFVGEQAFQRCRKVTKIMLPNVAFKIGNSAFSNTGVVNISIPDGCTVGRFAFARSYYAKTLRLGGNLIATLDPLFLRKPDEKYVEPATDYNIFKDCKALTVEIDSGSGGNPTYVQVMESFGLQSSGVGSTYMNDSSGMVRRLFYSYNREHAAKKN